jgi:hypothetical protein
VDEQEERKEKSEEKKNKIKKEAEAAVPQFTPPSQARPLLHICAGTTFLWVIFKPENRHLFLDSLGFADINRQSSVWLFCRAYQKNLL